MSSKRMFLGCFGLVLAALAAVPLIADETGNAGERGKAAASQNTVITVKEMCGGCVKRIQGKLDEYPEIAEVKCDIPSKTVTVTPQPKTTLSPVMLWDAMDSIGKTPTKLSGPSGTYTSRPKTSAQSTL